MNGVHTQSNRQEPTEDGNKSHLNGSTAAIDKQHVVSLRERLSHLTWAWFTFPQSTGGIAILLGKTPHRFNGLETIGAVVFIFNIVLFSTLSAAMVTRFILFPEKIKKSFVHPTECYFFPSFWLSAATILGCMQIYGVPHSGPWLLVAIRVLFWIYFTITLCQSFIGYIVFAVNTPIKALTSNPLPWIFNTLCAMLTGSIGGLIAPDQPPDQRVPIIVAAFAMQGLGFIVSLFVVAMYFYHILQQGLPPPPLRTGMFMPVGVGGFTIIATIDLANAIPAEYGYFAAHPMAKEILLVVALFFSIFILIFTLWVFMLAVLGNLLCIREAKFTLTGFALIFPNVGGVLGLIEVGTELSSPALLWVSTALTILLVIFWLLDIVLAVKAVLTKQIMWPGRDEDKED